MKYNDTIFHLITDRETNLKQHLDEEIMKYADEHRVLLPILNIIGDHRWPEEEKLLIDRYHEFLKIIQVFNERQIHYLNIKGVVMNKYYPRDLPRQSRDFDVLVKDVDNYWIAHQVLIENGYKMNAFPVLYSKQGRVVGFCKYIKESKEGVTVEFEVNIGGFAIGYYDCYVDEAMFETYEILTHRDIDIKIPNDKYNLSIFIFETSGRVEPRFRDVIDFHFMMNQLDQEDIDFARRLLGTKYLKNILNTFLKIEEKISKGENCSYVNHFTTSMKSETLHTLPVLFKDQHTPKKLFYYYARMVGDHLIARDRLLKIVKYLENKLNPFVRFHLGIPTHFIPVSEDVKGGWEWKNKDSYYYLKTDIGTFVPSNFCIFKEGEFETLKEMCHTVFQK